MICYLDTSAAVKLLVDEAEEDLTGACDESAQGFGIARNLAMW